MRVCWSGYTCVFPYLKTCSGCPKETTKHHRKTRKNGGSSDPANILKVQRKLHEAFHLIFGHSTPEGTAKILNRWIDPAFEVIATRRRQCVKSATG